MVGCCRGEWMVDMQLLLISLFLGKGDGMTDDDGVHDDWTGLGHNNELAVARKMGDHLSMDPGTIVVVWKHLCMEDSEAEIDLQRALFKAITTGTMPNITTSDTWEGTCSVWARKYDAALMKDKREIKMRYVNADMMMIGDPLAFWPPPLMLATSQSEKAEGSSACWLVKFPESPEKRELQEMAKDMEAPGKPWGCISWFRKRKS